MTTPDTQTSAHGPIRGQESPPYDAAAAAQPSPDDDAQDQPPQEPPESDRASTNAEAAKYRKQLRKAESERDAMAERVAAYQRRECERLVADLLDQAPDLWLFGDDPADFYDGDVLEEDHLRAAVAALLDQRPGLAKTPPRAVRQWGQYNSSNPTGQTGWGDVLRH